jgi:lipopolysaccharide transport system ATP-binding protein
VGRYQKLLYAPSDKREIIREQIRRSNEQGITYSNLIDDAKSEHQTPIAHAQEQQESFDPHLKPSSTIEYESHGAIIGTPKILTIGGTQANGLVRGRKYRYCYEVTFNRAVTYVRLGMSIKTTTGLSIGGALSAPSLKEAIQIVDAGTNIRVEFAFNCYLNPGVYFMNAGVFGCCNEEEIVLHRKADVIAFRVLPVPSNIETEMINFGFEPAISFNE